MVRLVITDFKSKEDNELFYNDEDIIVSQKIFTYFSFKKYALYFPKYETVDEIYSLNLISKKYLDANQFLVHISDSEYVILFNHKTVYSAKINSNFITDDIIKSILINRHIVMLSSGGDIDKIYYIINSKYKSAIENILKQNTKNEKNEVVAISLGDINDLVKPLNPLENISKFLSKYVILFSLLIFSFWYCTVAVNQIADKFLYKESIENLKRELLVQNAVLKKQNILFKNSVAEYEKASTCISKQESK